MANAYNIEENHWEITKALNIVFPKEAKLFWDTKLMEPLHNIEVIINKELDVPMQLVQSDEVVFQTLLLVKFIRSIKKGDHVKMDEALLYIPMEPRELISHHLGNDIQKISFILSDSLDDGNKLLSAENRRKVSGIIEEIKRFNDRFFKTIRCAE